ncbi:MAG: hypothetical protein ACQES4_08555 [Bacillota bacterium]
MFEVKKAAAVFKENIFNLKLCTGALTSALLLLLYALTFYLFLPEGVNRFFTQRLITILLPALILLLVISALIYYYRRDPKLFNEKGARPLLDKNDLPLLLIPMTPIARYILLNLDILNLFHALLVFVIFLALALLLTLVIPLLFARIGIKSMLLMTGLSFTFTIFNMAALSADNFWHMTGSLRAQLPVLMLAFLIPLLIYHLDRRFLGIAAAVFFLAGLYTTTAAPGEIEQDFGGSRLYEMTVDKEPLFKPDIFLITYESYVENETMLQYGIDNSAQEQFLADKGFHIYRGTWSVGGSSLSSMDRMLNVSETVGTRKGVSGNGVVHNVLREHGYKTYGIFASDYIFRGVESSYDYSFPAFEQLEEIQPYLLLTRQVFEGAFRFDAGFDQVNYAQYLREKQMVLEENSNAPRFVYTHNKYPNHSQNSGQCLPNEIELYSERLDTANQEMREDVLTVVKNNPDAVIIICGDHGPYLTKNCTELGSHYDSNEINRLDIQDRYGSFLAIRWPEENEINHDQIEILQDVFPVIFAWLYADQNILNTRLKQVTTNANNRISGVLVRDGVIEGGADDGKLLFESME